MCSLSSRKFHSLSDVLRSFLGVPLLRASERKRKAVNAEKKIASTDQNECVRSLTRANRVNGLSERLELREKREGNTKSMENYFLHGEQLGLL